MSGKSTYNNTPLATIVPGMTIESAYYLCEASEKLTKTGKPYCDLKLRDKTGARIAKYWSAFEGFETCSYVFIKGHSQEYGGATNIIAKEIVNINEDDVDIDDFVLVVDNIDEYKSTFDDAASQINNPTLKAIFKAVFTDKIKELFFNTPASEGARYGSMGGALMQSCRVSAAAEQMAYVYNLKDISKELLIAASFISNSGKIYAFDLVDHIPTVTLKGSLYGDVSLSYNRLMLGIINLKQNPKKCKSYAGIPEEDDSWSLDEDIILQLTHLILSSRSGNINPGNKDERMGATLPQSLESMILSQCFLSDDRVAQTYDAIKATELANCDPNDPFTPWDFSTRRRFLKPDWLIS